MRKKSGTKQSHSEKVAKDIRRAIRKRYLAEEKIEIVLDSLKGEDSTEELCRRWFSNRWSTSTEPKQTYRTAPAWSLVRNEIVSSVFGMVTPR